MNPASHSAQDALAAPHPADAVARYGEDILASKGMAAEATCIQHGTTTVRQHSVNVARRCVALSRALGLACDERSLVRGALLHDYFLYDWHFAGADHPHHATRHAGRALANAERDFHLNDIERDVIGCHMFPLGPVPRTAEGWIITLADKACACEEVASAGKAYAQETVCTARAQAGERARAAIKLVTSW